MDPDEIERKLRAGDCTDGEIPRFISALHVYHPVMVWRVASTSTCGRVLTALASHNDPSVRRRLVYANMHIPQEALDVLKTDSDTRFREQVVRHSKTSNATLLYMAIHDEDPEIRAYAASRLDVIDLFATES